LPYWEELRIENSEVRISDKKGTGATCRPAERTGPDFAAGLYRWLRAQQQCIAATAAGWTFDFSRIALIGYGLSG